MIPKRLANQLRWISQPLSCSHMGCMNTRRHGWVKYHILCIVHHSGPVRWHFGARLVLWLILACSGIDVKHEDFFYFIFFVLERQFAQKKMLLLCLDQGCPSPVLYPILNVTLLQHTQVKMISLSASFAEAWSWSWSFESAVWEDRNISKLAG